MDGRPRAVDIVTLPYPGFPTDLQPQFIALNAVAEGTAMITENLFEARFRFVNELVRLGADVRTDGHHALVRGRPVLSGAPVEAADIRAGAGLCSRGSPRRATRRCMRSTTSSAATRGSPQNLVGIGAQIEQPVEQRRRSTTEPARPSPPLCPAARSGTVCYPWVTTRLPSMHPLASQEVVVSTVMVVGAGLMGSGIAQVSVVAGHDVILRDIDAASAGAGPLGDQASLTRFAAKGSHQR